MATTVAFCPDGRGLVTGAGDGTARVWDTSSGEEQHALLPVDELREHARERVSRRLLHVES